jgi:hypothetical protein
VTLSSIKGETEFSWHPGGFFLEQRARIDFMGLIIDALELIGYDPKTDTFPSTVFSDFAPEPLPYRWDVRGDAVTIAVSYGQLDATFTGAWREDGTFSGGWRPNPAPTRPSTSRTTSAGTVSTDSVRGPAGSARSRLHRAYGLSVRGIERLDRELGDGDLGRHTEPGLRGDE